MNAQSQEVLTLHLSQLYEQDYLLWLEETAKLLRNGDLMQIDRVNLAEEIEDMGRSEKRTLESNLEILLMHLLKYKYQPELRSNNWRSSILEHRNRLQKAFKESPSLSNHFTQVFSGSYQYARRKAAVETGLAIDVFSVESPFTQEQVLDFDFLPE